MGVIHFAQQGNTNLVCPDDLDDIIHASFVRDWRSAEAEVHQSAERTLSLLAEGPGYSLDEFVPAGIPFLVNAGHKRYSRGGRKGKHGFDVEKIPSEVIMSRSFIGSSSHVYVPMLSVKRRADMFVGPVSLPRFMVYEEEWLVEAEYDIKSAKFHSLENGKKINPEAIMLCDQPQQQSVYVTGNSTKIPFKHDGFNPSGGIRGFLFGSFYLLGHITKSTTRKVVYAGIDLSRVNRQLLHHFSTRGKLLRATTEGCGEYGWITKEQIDSFSYATYQEIGEAVKILSGDIDEFTGKLNRFLLYKAFKQKEGSFIVGNIEGDSVIMHLPYVKVKGNTRLMSGRGFYR